MCSTFKQRPIRPPLAGIVAVALLLLAAPLAAQDSNNATLSALSLSDPATDLNPAFDPNETSYRASVAHDVAFITVTATRSVEVAALLILPPDSKEGEDEHQVSLDVGANEIRVTVTLTGTGSPPPKTYTITVTRAESQSTDATLQSLSLSGEAMLKQNADPTKGFDPEEDTYTASVANTVDAITVTATPTVTQATAKIGEDDATGGGHEVSLRVGANTIRVTVAAVAGNTKAYTITVTRAASPSTDATLRSLSLSGGATLKQADDPTKGFDPEEDTYTASVAHAVASITVTATPNVSQATVGYPTDDAPGTGGHQVSLDVGENMFTVTVTATGGGTPKEYRITVNRAMSPSTDATLRSLSLSGGATLKQRTDPTKGFDPNEDTYDAEVAHAVASITVTATPNVSQATVAITPPDDAPGTPGIRSPS